MESDHLGSIELIDYFEAPSDLFTVRTWTVKIRSGLTENSVFLYGDIDKLSEEELLQKVKRALSSPLRDTTEMHFLGVDLLSADGASLDVLKRHGLLTKSYEPTKDVLEFFAIPEFPYLETLKARYGQNWEVAAVSEYVLETYPPYSETFYAALVRYHYYISENDFLAGYLWAEMVWKFMHERSALAGEKNLSALAAAELAKPKKAASRRSAKLKCVSRLWWEARKELGARNMHKDTNAAQAIYALAEKERPSELLVKKTGAVIKPEAIRRLLSVLRNSGKIDSYAVIFHSAKLRCKGHFI